MAISSVLTDIPTNQNYVHSNKFSFYFPTLSFTRFFVQSVNVPDVSTQEVFVPTQFNPTYRHGDQLNFDPLAITVLVDEDLRVWEESFNWLRALTSPTKYSEYIKNGGFKSLSTPYADAVLIINTNSNIPNLKFTFKDCHPTSLTGLSFSSASSPETTMSATITYRYDYYTLERLTT